MTEVMGTERLVHLRVAALIPHSENVRKNVSPELEELAASIKENGLIQPLLVTPDGEGGHIILAGHRRARAAMLAGLLAVPCMVRESVGADEQTVLMLVENTQRKDLTPIEQAFALSALMRKGKSQRELARMLSKSDAWVSNRLGMLDLPEHIIKKINDREITVSEAEALVRENRNPKKKEHDRGWAPPFFSEHHPLSKQVKRMCKARGHNGRRIVGGIGCGACWEKVIRDDERGVIEAEQELASQDTQGTVRLEGEFTGQTLDDNEVYARVNGSRNPDGTEDAGTYPTAASGAEGSRDEVGAGGGAT